MTALGLDVRQNRVSYGNTVILDDVGFHVERNRTLAVLGQSGCGKTTLLRAIAGLIPGTQGNLTFEGSRIDHLPPSERRVVYLDQDPLLFEHLNVFENVAFALRLAGCSQADIRSSVSELLNAVELAEHSSKRSWQLSGGQKQRVAFARAILASPRVLLLDEPFGSLDSRSRSHMQQLFLRLRNQYSMTCLFVTHDVKEALVVGDQLGLMSGGSLRIYASHSEFIHDEATGAKAERSFWLNQEQTP